MESLPKYRIKESIAMALQNGQLYKSLFENMLNGFAHCQAIWDENGKLEDWIYLVVNPAFETQTGLKNVAGRSVREVIPGIRENSPELFEMYERVMKNKSRDHFEQYVEGLKIWFDISVYSVDEDTFTAVFQNITEQKNMILAREKANLEISRAYDETLAGWARALRYRDENTDGHSERVTGMAVRLARAMNMTDVDIVDIRRGALLHDIGKMFLPDSILLKPGKLDEQEQDLMQRHPQVAFDMLSPTKFMGECVVQIPYCHHEKWDGSGYPRGLKGEQIPLCARVFSICDVFDAMTSDRPYRRALSKNFALKFIAEQSGKSFDPQVVEAFLNMMQEVIMER